jgi:hypothetical protein
MATLAEHRSKALRNERLIRHHALDQGDFVEWAITVLFYAALHWIRALSAQEGFSVTDYRAERIALVTLPAFQHGAQEMKLYRALKDASQDARYEMAAFTALEYRDLEQNCYGPVKRFILSQLRP